MTRTTTTALLLALLLPAAWTPLDAQERTFVETLGEDTTSVESFVRTDSELRGRYLIRPPRTQVVEYEGTFGEDGAFDRFTATWTTPETNPDGPPSMTAVYTFDGDSVRVRVERGGGEPRTVTVASPDGITVPFLLKLPAVYGIFDHMSRVRAERGVERLTFYTLAPGAARAAPNAVELHEDGRVSMLDFGNPVMAEVGSEGGLRSIDASPTTHKVQAEPVEDADIEGLARRYAAMDARGEGLGPASTRDTVTVASAGAEFTIDYGRPAKRGRDVWGGVVDFGEVWRTGADAATHFTTTEPLRIGGEELPAGSYTLWTVPTETGMTLIVNEQTGQWGTQYDETKDLFRVPMERVFLREPVERLTLDVEPTDDGGVLTIAWDRLRFSVPLEVVGAM